MTRVALYAEGRAELGMADARTLRPGTVLTANDCGPGHLLVRRCVAAAWNLAPTAILFVAPLRRFDGHLPRGADLYHAPTLRQLLTWADPKIAPSLCVVLIDENGDKSRYGTLVQKTGELRMPRVVAVARREFEAWLIADTAALCAALGMSVDAIPEPEVLKPREAKARLAEWLKQAGSGRVSGVKHEQIANSLDLALVSDRCPSFKRFLDDLRALRTMASG